MTSKANADQDSSPTDNGANIFNILEDMGGLRISSDSSGSSQSKSSIVTTSTSAPFKLQAAIPLITSRKANKQAQTMIGKRFGTHDMPPPTYGTQASSGEMLQLSSRSTTAIQPPKKLGFIPPMHSTAAMATLSPSTLLEDWGTNPEQEEIARLKKQLEVAKSEINRQNREIVQQQITHHSINQILDSPSEASFPANHGHVSAGPSCDMPMFTHSSPATSPASFERFQSPWGNSVFTGAGDQQHLHVPGWNAALAPLWSARDMKSGASHTARTTAAPLAQRPFRLEAFENQQPLGVSSNTSSEQNFRRISVSIPRPMSNVGAFHSSLDSFSGDQIPGFSPSMTPQSVSNYRSYQQTVVPYQPSAAGTPLSATALEFNAGSFQPDTYVHTNPWNASVRQSHEKKLTRSLTKMQSSSESNLTYMAPMEPMNYRRLLDRNMSCDWKYIVDKIVCNHDQQASIFLQQKLKIATSDQKRELVDAIIAQAYSLMINRFGNFLVQRCLEHGTPDQVIAIANAIRGNTLSLSMDAFGCHVVQKAFDVVPEEFKAIMVHELLRRIPETVIHRYACHVWQKLFELRWSDSPPQIMKYVNDALRGMWHEVALGETGSLVVQNIFENCLEEDKRPCINEVLASLDIIAHGQFGNWCIQHICEHGAPADKSRAIEHVLRFATEYSTDQFASKVVEKCLKIGGPEFLDRYLERVCEGRPDRPRMPLIDISGDQYGNYLVQYILINAGLHHKEIVANHVRKHMVSLRGSKFGSRVAMLCCNPASATRPGPATGLPMNNRFALGGAMGQYTRPPTGPYR